MAEDDDSGTNLFAMPWDGTDKTLAQLVSPLTAAQLASLPPGEGSATNAPVGGVAESTPTTGFGPSGKTTVPSPGVSAMPADASGGASWRTPGSAGLVERYNADNAPSVTVTGGRAPLPELSSPQTTAMVGDDGGPRSASDAGQAGNVGNAGGGGASWRTPQSAARVAAYNQRPQAPVSLPYDTTSVSRSSMVGDDGGPAAGGAVASGAGSAGGLASIPGYVPRDVRLAAQGSGGVATATDANDSPAMRLLNRIGLFPGYPQDQASQLEEKIAAESVPVNEYDPNHPEYKPGLGTKVLRGIAAYFGGGIPGVFHADYNAGTGAYQAAEDARKGKLAADQQALGDLRTDYDKTLPGYKENREYANTVNTVSHDEALDNARQQNAQTREQLAEVQRQLADEKDPGRQMQLRFGYLAQHPELHLSPDQRNAFGLVGKLPEPAAPRSVSAEEQEFYAWQRAFEKAHGYAPTDKDIEGWRSKAGERGGGEGKPDQRQSMIDAASGEHQKFLDDWLWNPPRGGKPGYYSSANVNSAKTLKPTEVADRLNVIARKLDRDLAAKGLPIVGNEWTVGADGRVAATQRPGQPQQQPQPQPQGGSNSGSSQPDASVRYFNGRRYRQNGAGQWVGD